MATLLEQIKTAPQRTYKMRDLGRVVTGKTPSKDNPTDWGHEVDFITPTDFSGDGKHLAEIKRKISAEGANRYKNMILPPEAVVVTCIGSDMGKVIISQRTALTNQQINSIVVNRGNFDVDFVFYKLKSLYQELRSIAEEGGSTMPIITKTTFENIELDAPELPIQQKIAKILSAYDEKIENNYKIIKNIEATAQTIFNEWFVRFHFPGYKKSAQIESEKGMIPEGWEIKQLSEIARVVLGGTPSRNKPEFWSGNIPWINSGEVNKLRVVEATEYITEAGLANSNASVMKVGTVLIAITGATLGQVSRLEIESAANQSVVGVFSKEKIFNEFLYLYIKSNVSELISGASGGAQQHINKQVVEHFQIIVPMNDVMSEFHFQLKPIFESIKELLMENMRLRKLGRQLLDKLI